LVSSESIDALRQVAPNGPPQRILHKMQMDTPIQPQGNTLQAQHEELVEKLNLLNVSHYITIGCMCHYYTSRLRRFYFLYLVFFGSHLLNGTLCVENYLCIYMAVISFTNIPTEKHFLCQYKKSRM
uniref:PhoLip_ATPase_N domain-containing protein n=1 Tax=Echinostoma caproni TaxID=27848 RepID=A0A183A3J0_9TREM